MASPALAPQQPRRLPLDQAFHRMEDELNDAERKAWDSLSRYKFQMFGYWAGIWVHLNRIGGFGRPNPFTDLVRRAKCYPTPLALREKGGS
jgi:hypothetical protein